MTWSWTLVGVGLRKGQMLWKRVGRGAEDGIFMMNVGASRHFGVPVGFENGLVNLPEILRKRIGHEHREVEPGE